MTARVIPLYIEWGKNIRHLTMIHLLKDNQLILMEAAVVERVRRDSGIHLHPRLVHAPLIYDDRGRQALTAIYEGYLEIASEAGVMPSSSGNRVARYAKLRATAAWPSSFVRARIPPLRDLKTFR